MARTKTTPSYRNQAPRRVARDYPELQELHPDSPLARLHARLLREADARGPQNRPLTVTPIRALSPNGHFHFPDPTADEDPEYVRYLQHFRQSLPSYHPRSQQTPAPTPPPPASPEVITVSSSDDEAICFHCRQRLPRNPRTTGMPFPPTAAPPSPVPEDDGPSPPDSPRMPPSPTPPVPSPAPAQAGPSSSTGPPPKPRVYTRRSKPT